MPSTKKKSAKSTPVSAKSFSTSASPKPRSKSSTPSAQQKSALDSSIKSKPRSAPKKRKSRITRLSSEITNAFRQNPLKATVGVAGAITGISALAVQRSRRKSAAAKQAKDHEKWEKQRADALESRKAATAVEKFVAALFGWSGNRAIPPEPPKNSISKGTEFNPKAKELLKFYLKRNKMPELDKMMEQFEKFLKGSSNKTVGDVLAFLKNTFPQNDTIESIDLNPLVQDLRIE